LAGDTPDAALHRRIGERLEQMYVTSAHANRLFYLSTPPSLAPRIVTELGAHQFAAEDKGWSRLIVEKPFGTDLASAQHLNATVLRVFDERQVYRIDHYLGKDTVQN